MGEEVLCFFKTPKVALGSTCLHVQGTPGPVFPVLKRAERAADFLPLSSAEFKNEWTKLTNCMEQYPS